jgi:hypothetical protein
MYLRGHLHHSDGGQLLLHRVPRPAEQLEHAGGGGVLRHRHRRLRLRAGALGGGHLGLGGAPDPGQSNVSYRNCIIVLCRHDPISAD